MIVESIYFVLTVADLYSLTLLLFVVLLFLVYYSGMYVGRSESKERFAIQRYLLIIGKKQNIQVLSHTFTYFST